MILGTWQTAAPVCHRTNAFSGSIRERLCRIHEQWSGELAFKKGRPDYGLRSETTVSLAGNGLDGGVNAFRYENRFNLQVNAAGELRVIIIQQRFETTSWFYVGYDIYKPQHPGMAAIRTIGSAWRHRVTWQGHNLTENNRRCSMAYQKRIWFVALLILLTFSLVACQKPDEVANIDQSTPEAVVRALYKAFEQMDVHAGGETSGATIRSER